MTDIKKIREKRGISQKELAAKLNVSPSTVSQWENGLRNPSLVNVKRMSNILHNPMVGATVAVAVSVEEAAKAGKF